VRDARAMVGGLVVVLAACAGRGAVPPTAPTTTGVIAPSAPVAPVAACASAEHRQFDFWLGDWDLVVRARKGPKSEIWDEARGTQHITATLGGCVVAEDFHADGPGVPWAGQSVSSWQPTLGQWRQTWVDDSGGYLAFTGGLEGGVMTLYGEPTTKDGVTTRMRMVFLDVTASALRWEWQRSVDGGVTWSPTMTIAYRRR